MVMVMVLGVGVCSVVFAASVCCLAGGSECQVEVEFTGELTEDTDMAEGLNMAGRGLRQAPWTYQETCLPVF